MTWGEAWRLVQILLADPSSWVAAVTNDWDYPTTREDLTLRELYDLQHRSKAKRTPKALPRPWDKRGKNIGGGTNLSIDEFKAIKAALSEAGTTQPRDALGRFAPKPKAVNDG